MPSSFQVDFIGIGAPKCGSTWVFHALGQHPEICLSEPKETRYFSREDFWPDYTRHHATRRLNNLNHAKSLTCYAKHYRHCPARAIKGEFSPEYMFDKNACFRIFHHLPNVRLLVCLRNPIDRAYSVYWSNTRYRKKNVSQTFEQAIASEPLYLLRGKYARYLQSYLEYFRRDKIKIILFEDILEAPEQTVRDLFTFLELDSRIGLNLECVPKNSAKKSRFVSPAPVMGWLTAWLIQRDQAVLMRKLRNLRLKERVLKLSTVECPPEPMNEHTREHLRRVFRQDIDKLETLIGRDLTAWK